MSQLYRRKVKDLAKNRRDYLFKLAQANLQRGIGILATLGCGSLLMLVAGMFCIYLVIGTGIGISDGHMPDLSKDPFLIYLFVWFVVWLGIFGTLTWLAAKFWQSSTAKAKSLPYVPPVSKQIAALPPVEILLRGSNEPATTPGELLRAAHSPAISNGKDLLRARCEEQPERPQSISL